MKTHRLNSAIAIIYLAVTAACYAQDTPKTFMVGGGAFPWYDRINSWQLTTVPVSVNGNGPIPQQNCSIRGVEVPGSPKYILLGVANADLEKFKAAFPSAEPTGDSIAVCRPDGSSAIPYTIVNVPNPPATIQDKTLSAGLILLQIGDRVKVAAPAK